MQQMPTPSLDDALPGKQEHYTSPRDWLTGWRAKHAKAPQAKARTHTHSHAHHNNVQTLTTINSKQRKKVLLPKLVHVPGKNCKQHLEQERVDAHTAASHSGRQAAVAKPSPRQHRTVCNRKS
jgi:hypothetical protein